MRMCVYDLAVGSDVAVNETEVAKEKDDAARMEMVEAAISRVLDKPLQEASTTWPESDCSVIATWKAGSTCTAPQDIGNSSTPLESDPVLCRDLVTGNVEGTISLDLSDMNPTSSPSTDSKPAWRTHDTTLPDIDDSNPASSTSTASEAVSSVVSDPGHSPGPDRWAWNPISTGSDSIDWTGLNSSTDWTGSDAQGGSSSHCWDSGVAIHGTGNLSGGSEKIWCPELDPVWTPPETQTTSINSNVSKEGDKDTTTAEGSDQKHAALDPAGSSSETDSSTMWTESDATTHDTANPSGEPNKNWWPAFDPVERPVTDLSTTLTDSNAGEDDTSSWRGSNQGFPQLDPVLHLAQESVCPLVQETLKSDAVVEGGVANSLSFGTMSDAEEKDDSSAYPGGCDESDEHPTGTGALDQGRFFELDTVRLREVSVVGSPASDSVCPPALGFRKDREEEEFAKKTPCSRKLDLNLRDYSSERELGRRDYPAASWKRCHHLGTTLPVVKPTRIDTAAESRGRECSMVE
eukprot:jgi/Undpi1/4557/HiC_scaffold_18.g07911.m1